MMCILNINPMHAKRHLFLPVSIRILLDRESPLKVSLFHLPLLLFANCTGRASTDFRPQRGLTLSRSCERPC